MDSGVAVRQIRCNLMWYPDLRLGDSRPAPGPLNPFVLDTCGETSGATTLESILSVRQRCRLRHGPPSHRRTPREESLPARGRAVLPDLSTTLSGDPRPAGHSVLGRRSRLLRTQVSLPGVSPGFFSLNARVCASHRI